MQWCGELRLWDAGGQGGLLTKSDSGCCGRGMAVLGAPFCHEAVCFQVDETGPVGELADEFFVCAGELLAGVAGAGSEVTDLGVASEVPVEGVKEEPVVVFAGSDGGLVQCAGVESDPRPVCDALDAIGDDQVSVKL